MSMRNLTNILNEEFEAGDVMDLCDLSRPLLSQWIGRGYIKPSKPAKGQGTKNIFTVQDICRIEIFKRLNQTGFSRGDAGGFAFAPSDTEGGKAIAETLSDIIKKFIDFRIKFRKAESILYAPLRPDPVYFALFMRDDCVSAYRLESGNDFEGLYNDMKGYNIFHILNLMEIVDNTLSKLEDKD